MKTMLKAMQRQSSGIPSDILHIFEAIIRKNENGQECDNEFSMAMEEHLSQEQRFRLYERNGGCMGTGHDKKRKAFALEHADLAIDERLVMFSKTFGIQAVLSDDSTILVYFTCPHRYHKVKRDKGIPTLLPPIESYFERCAGGRLHVLETALGVKMKIKSVDKSSLDENFDNPVVYMYEIVG